jgi:diaminopimelate epimerase
MTYYNSDGNESTMCGNGGRCISAFARDLGLIEQKARFVAVDGIHIAEVTAVHPLVFRLKMNDSRIGQTWYDGLFVDTGSPHIVTSSPDVEAMDIVGAGRALRNDMRFAPGGTNVNFVEKQRDGLFVRTYERGVEDETLSCGTGVTAAALAMASREPGNPGFYKVLTRGGTLTVSFTQDGERFSNIWLEGEAAFVFSGEITI